MGTTIFEKCDATFMRRVMLERWTQQFVRMRSKVVKRLDNYYFKEMTGEELRVRQEEAVIVREDINSIADMEKLVFEE